MRRLRRRRGDAHRAATANVMEFRQTVVERMLVEAGAQPTKEVVNAAAKVLLARRPKPFKPTERLQAEMAWAPSPRAGRAYVYVIGPATGPVKVGFAKDVKTRLADLQVGSHQDLVLHGAVCTEFASRVESLCHEALAPHHIRGEWFDVEPMRAVYLVERQAHELSIPE